MEWNLARRRGLNQVHYIYIILMDFRGLNCDLSEDAFGPSNPLKLLSRRAVESESQAKAEAVPRLLVAHCSGLTIHPVVAGNPINPLRYT